MKAEGGRLKEEQRHPICLHPSAFILHPSIFPPGIGFAEGFGIGKAIWVQFVGAAATVGWAGGLSWVILKVVGAVVGLRVSEEDEIEGLDITTHGERGYEI